jgi:hypothetical protein
VPWPEEILYRKMTSKFRTAAWDPSLISAQIVALQASWYATGSAAVLVAEVLTGSPLSVRHVLDFRELRLDNIFGWTLVAAHLANAAAG